ncbi:4'-phosphopantetheinyl transferase superfamily protein [Pseudoflavonifractor sp. 524-17]|uniref:4'-phosphopantetheinyl transferase family protein n=1 Tax=Pseudoflavonifractor sp. 524-17 TaxID=2304577 RepID=UPI00325B4265
MLAGERLHFNLSHSGPFALCGVGDAPLGVDIEAIRPRRPALPRYIMSDREFRWYEAQGGRWEDFYTLWTLKESICKYTGQGLDRAARRIEAPLLAPGECARWQGLWLRAYGGPDWRAACCGEAEPGTLMWLSEEPV